jgi:MazG family protein
MAAPHPKLDELIAVLERLRAPNGCAWDREQTHESLVRYLVEETYELVDAIESGDRDALIEELGDVLYQVIFHSDLAAHTPGEEFTIEDVAAHMTAKMVMRHPHVFGDAVAKDAMNIQTADDVMAVWDDLKATEKPHRSSVLDGIPQSMPALALADKLLGRAEKVGLSVPDAGSAADADAGSDVAAAPTTEPELGAQLLRIAAEARAAGLDPERALRAALRELQDSIREAEAEPSAEPATEPSAEPSAKPATSTSAG